MFPAGQEGFVVCGACFEHNAPQDEECHICGVELDSVFDEASYGLFAHAPDDDPLGIFASQEADSDVATLPRINSLHCIQCDSPHEECGCGLLYMSFDEAIMDMIEAHIDAYDPSSACDTCLFIFNPRCEPLRGWLRMWIEDKESVEAQQLTGCEDYRSY